MNTKPLILITNDDGITSKGIKALIEVAREFGTPFVVAPDSPQSGKGHAITLTDPLRLHKVDIFNNLGIEAYECSGTPVDCVKIAQHVLLKDQKIDLCLSGINHGSNAALNIIYSGTMSAAMEASMEGINSIGFSLENHNHDANFDSAKEVVRKVLNKVFEHGFGKSNLLNINIPNIPFEDIKGLKICRQAEANWKEDFMEGTDPRGGKYYWLTGVFSNKDGGKDTDIFALEHGFVSIVPSQHDLTDYQAIESLGFMEV